MSRSLLLCLAAFPSQALAQSYSNPLDFIGVGHNACMAAFGNDIGGWNQANATSYTDDEAIHDFAVDCAQAQLSQPSDPALVDSVLQGTTYANLTCAIDGSAPFQDPNLESARGQLDALLAYHVDQLATTPRSIVLDNLAADLTQLDAAVAPTLQGASLGAWHAGAATASASFDYWTDPAGGASSTQSTSSGAGVLAVIADDMLGAAKGYEEGHRYGEMVTDDEILQDRYAEWGAFIAGAEASLKAGKEHHDIDVVTGSPEGEDGPGGCILR